MTPPPPKALILVIEDHSCEKCGNKWTHCYHILSDEKFTYWGGTPQGSELQLPVAAYTSRRTPPKPSCQRCIIAHSIEIIRASREAIIDSKPRPALIIPVPDMHDPDDLLSL